MALLPQVLIYDQQHDPILPKMFYVPRHGLKEERSNPGSQTRKPSVAGSPHDLFLWGQAMLVIAELLTSNLLQVHWYSEDYDELKIR